MTQDSVLRRRALSVLASVALVCCGPCNAAILKPKEHIDIRIEGVPREMADNVRAYLTLSRYVEREDLTDPQVRRLADRAVDEAADALRPFGYYKPIIKSRTSRDEPNWIVRLRIQPGEPVLMRDVDVQDRGARRGGPHTGRGAQGDALENGHAARSYGV